MISRRRIILACLIILFCGYQILKWFRENQIQTEQIQVGLYQEEEVRSEVPIYSGSMEEKVIMPQREYTATANSVAIGGVYFYSGGNEYASGDYYVWGRGE